MFPFSLHAVLHLDPALPACFSDDFANSNASLSNLEKLFSVQSLVTVRSSVILLSPKPSKLGFSSIASLPISDTRVELADNVGDPHVLMATQFNRCAVAALILLPASLLTAAATIAPNLDGKLALLACGAGLSIFPLAILEGLHLLVVRDAVKVYVRGLGAKVIDAP